MRAIYTFLSYLWPHLWWFLTSGPLVVEPMAAQLFNGYETWINQYISRQRRRQITYGLSLLGIVVASFFAFTDVYLELQTAQHSLAETREKLAAKGPESQTMAIARLLGDNVRLETELRSTQHALSALQDSLKARRLSPEGRKKLTDALATHNGQPFGVINVRAFPSCHECMAYVYDFVNAINSVPTWAATGGGNHYIKVDFSGIGIGVKDTGVLPPIASIFVDALTATALPFTLETLDFLAPDRCMIIVGNKP